MEPLVPRDRRRGNANKFIKKKKKDISFYWKYGAGFQVMEFPSLETLVNQTGIS